MRVAGIPLGVGNSTGQTYDPNLCFGLYHFDGSQGSTAFTDSSPAARHLAQSGQALIWAYPYFGDGSLRLPSNPYDFASINSTVNLGNSDFSFELFFYFDFSYGATYKGLVAAADDSTTKDWLIYLNGQNLEFGVNLSTDGFVTMQHQTAATSAAFNYVKVTRVDGVIKIGLNGVESTTSITCGTQSVTNIASNTLVGGMYASSPNNVLYPNGFVDEVRLNKQAVSGWAIPASAFTE